MLKMIKNPFFSILIPTYKRANNLKLAIQCILMQDFSDFEIIISDNNSNDGTEDIVRKFKDPRIKYSKNVKNIGWIPNLRKAINAASGTYILLHGDDDFIIFPQTLSRLYALIKKESYGFVRMNYLSVLQEKDLIFDFHKDIQRDFKIKPKENKKIIVDFIEKIDPFFITGIVFKNNYPKKIDLMNSEFVAWFKIIFYNIYQFGGYFVQQQFLAASWSQNASHPRYQLSNGQFRFEKYFTEVSRLLGGNEYEQFLNKRLKIIIREFPAAKYYTNNSNLKIFSKRVLEISPKLRFSFEYWFWFFFSLLAPKLILAFIRKHIFFRMIANTNIPNYAKMHKRISYLNSLLNA
ncbi:MAG: glycosyltransferase family 2 protein [Candidatus Levybacteria bacterium]|nr:glycosyltransferase family 2 protein [Candidatus Levybacteria bacterium]